MRQLKKVIETFAFCEYICTYERIKNDRNGNSRYEIRITNDTLSKEPKTWVFNVSASGNIKDTIKAYIRNYSHELQ